MVAHVEIWVGEYERAHEMLADLVARLRAEGAMSMLPYALGGLAYTSFFLGDWQAAEAHATESIRVAEEVGQPTFVIHPATCLGLLTGAQGRNSEARAHLERARAVADEFGAESMRTVIGWAYGQVDLAIGAYEDAAVRLAATGRFSLERGLEEPAVGTWAQDLPEAYVRLGRLSDAEATLEVLEAQAQRTGRRLAHAAAERCRGLLAGPTDFEGHFKRALRWHRGVACPLERARTQLCFGERLRRAGRRIEARGPLREAVAIFADVGAVPWHERATRELRATGERARRRTPEAADQLTPQELQVAYLVIAGATNREAAAALFVSPRTIETHLSHAYRKLGVRSRVELAHQLDPAAERSLASG
jgi:DNA-binding CsgD family transcriptional regulator/sugar phosphate isomerase/epimerase